MERARAVRVMVKGESGEWQAMNGGWGDVKCGDGGSRTKDRDTGFSSGVRRVEPRSFERQVCWAVTPALRRLIYSRDPWLGQACVAGTHDIHGSAALPVLIAQSLLGPSVALPCRMVFAPLSVRWGKPSGAQL